MTGFRSESVAAFRRNGCRLALELVAGLGRNTHRQRTPRPRVSWAAPDSAGVNFVGCGVTKGGEGHGDHIERWHKVRQRRRLDQQQQGSNSSLNCP